MPPPAQVGAFTVEDERFRPYALPNAALTTLGEGFAWLEGPVWFADHQCLLVSDLPANRILRWSQRGGIGVFREPSNFANGHARDREGRLLGCSHGGRSLLRTELDGTLTVLAAHHGGKRLNGPNDVVCHSDGSIWFTDPHYGGNTDYEGGKHAPELPPALYRLQPGGRLDVMASDFDGPNGLCFSPDGQKLYVSETGPQFAANAPKHIRVFGVAPNGALSGGEIFHTVSPGYADGFRADEDGNIWTSAGDGVHCIAPDGQRIGSIRLPCVVSNLAFGGRNRAQLFICASHTLFALYTNTRGAARP